MPSDPHEFDLISRFPSWIFIAAMTAEQFSTVVSLLTSRQGERAVPVIVDAEEYPATCSSEPQVLVADACSPRSRQRHSRGFGFPLSNLESDKTVSAKCLQLIHCAQYTRLPVCPRLHIRGPPERCHIFEGARWPPQAITVAWRLFLEAKRFPPRAPPEHMLFTTSSSPQNGHRGDSALRQSNCLFVSKHSHNEAHGDRFVAWEECWYCSSLWWVASLSTPAVDSMPLMSLRLFPRFVYHSASLSPCLISWSQQLSGPSSSLKWRRSSLVKSVGACQCQPIPCSTLCTVATGPSHISSPFALQRQPRSSSAKVSGLCSAMRLNCLRHWYEAFCEGIDEVTFDEECQHNFTTSACAFRAPQRRNHSCPVVSLTSLREKTSRSETIHCCRSKHAIKLAFV